MDLGVAGSDNTTGTVLYLNPTTTQTNPVQINFPDHPQMSFSDSGTSSFLSDTNDNSLLAFAAYNTADTTAPTLTWPRLRRPDSARAVGTLNASGGRSTSRRLTPTPRRQARQHRTDPFGNESRRLRTWYITDKSGLYTNNDNNPGGLTAPIPLDEHSGHQGLWRHRLRRAPQKRLLPSRPCPARQPPASPDCRDWLLLRPATMMPPETFKTST